MPWPRSLRRTTYWTMGFGAGAPAAAEEDAGAGAGSPSEVVMARTSNAGRRETRGWAAREEGIREGAVR